MVMRRLCDRIFFRGLFYVALMATLVTPDAEHHRTQSALLVQAHDDVCRIDLIINNRQQLKRHPSSTEP